MLQKIFKNKIVKGIIYGHVALAVGGVALFFYIKKQTKNHYENALQNTPYDAIIIPGFPFKGEKWHDIMKMRVIWSKYLYEQGYARHIIYSGSAVYSPYIEAEIMKLYGIALDIPEEVIFAENKAEHSTENLHYAYQLAKENGFEKIAVATDPYQSAMLEYFAEKRNFEVDFIPVQFDILKELDHADPSIDPSSAFVGNFVSLPDRQSFIDRLRGTMGEYVP